MPRWRPGMSALAIPTAAVDRRLHVAAADGQPAAVERGVVGRTTRGRSAIASVTAAPMTLDDGRPPLPDWLSGRRRRAGGRRAKALAGWRNEVRVGAGQQRPGHPIRLPPMRRQWLGEFRPGCQQAGDC